MRVLVLAATAVPLAGCFDFDLELDFEQTSMTLHSEQGRLTITGCATDGLLGCNDPQETQVKMQVQLDGVWRDVYRRKTSLELFPSIAYELTVPSPDDPYVGLALATNPFTVEELPWFDLELSRPGTVDRSAGRARFVFDGFRGATVTAALTSRCGADQLFTPVPIEQVGEGVLELSLDDQALHGTCTHDLRVTQALVEPDTGNAFVTVERTVHQTFDSSGH